MERTFLNALRNGHLEVVRETGSRNGHLEVVEYLVSQGADVRANRDHAVRASSINGHLDVVKSENFIERTIYFDNDEFHYYARYRNELIALLLRHVSEQTDITTEKVKKYLKNPKAAVAFVKIFNHAKNIPTDQGKLEVWISHEDECDDAIIKAVPKERLIKGLSPAVICTVE